MKIYVIKLAEYQKQIESGDIKPDSVQETACQELQRLYEELTVEKQQERKSSLFQRMFSSPPKEKNLVQSPKGIYMHGGVGRGKSMLMDLFVATLPDTVKVRRVHFHEFMVEVHDYIHSRRMDDGARGLVDQALPSLAELITRRYDVLCFDEFHVTDITDAMILGRLFKILFEILGVPLDLLAISKAAESSILIFKIIADLLIISNKCLWL